MSSASSRLEPPVFISARFWSAGLPRRNEGRVVECTPQRLEVAWKERRDPAGVLIELHAERFAQKLFFGADANAVANKKNKNGGAQRPPSRVSQSCGHHQPEHPKVDRIAHHSVRSLRDQFVPLNHARLVRPLLAQRAHRSQAKQTTRVRQRDSCSGKNHLAKK